MKRFIAIAILIAFSTITTTNNANAQTFADFADSVQLDNLYDGLDSLGFVEVVEKNKKNISGIWHYLDQNGRNILEAMTDISEEMILQDLGLDKVTETALRDSLLAKYDGSELKANHDKEWLAFQERKSALIKDMATKKGRQEVAENFIKNLMNKSVNSGSGATVVADSNSYTATAIDSMMLAVNSRVNQLENRVDQNRQIIEGVASNVYASIWGSGDAKKAAGINLERWLGNPNKRDIPNSIPR